MDLMEGLLTRRSVRRYTTDPVPDALVTEMLAAAMMAPSAGNQQPWQFVVVTERPLLEAAAAVHPWVGMAAKAPLGILVCGDLSLETVPGFWPQDCSAAMQNLLLAAHAVGLGAVWTGIYPLQERVVRFSRIFSLPDHAVPLGFAVIGHPAGASGVKDRFRPDRVHRNRWAAS